jgi:hypothetical protein
LLFVYRHKLAESGGRAVAALRRSRLLSNPRRDRESPPPDRACPRTKRPCGFV